jgi:uncharacterized RDD family membrane protein YckC
VNLDYRPDLHRVVTPEGIALHLQVASLADRLIAFTNDISWLLLAWLLGGAAAMLFHLPVFGGTAAAMVILFLFLSWTFYFPFFELRWNGATPGKRRSRIRVVRADGGPLTAEAVLARNFMRTVEVQVPLVFLFSSETMFAGHGGLLRLVGGGWVLALMLLPLCNRARMRAGDFIAGTRVIAVPEARLLPDLARARAPAPAAAAAPPPRCEFTREQLEIYGIYELQVLEDVLRKTDAPGGRQAATAVAEQIQRKIGFTPAAAPQLSPREFLQEFYAAQRRHLEQKLLLGRRQERKQSPGKGGGGDVAAR